MISVKLTMKQLHHILSYNTLNFPIKKINWIFITIFHDNSTLLPHTERSINMLETIKCFFLKKSTQFISVRLWYKFVVHLSNVSMINPKFQSLSQQYVYIVDHLKFSSEKWNCHTCSRGWCKQDLEKKNKPWSTWNCFCQCNMWVCFTIYVWVCWS